MAWSVCHPCVGLGIAGHFHWGRVSLELDCEARSHHAWRVSQTVQTAFLVGATLGAVVLTFVGSYYLQRWQARKDDRARRDQAIAEALTAAADLVIGIQAFRSAQIKRSTLRFWRDTQRASAIDAANIIQPRHTRYLMAAGVLALGQDKMIAQAVQKLTPKVTALIWAIGASGPEFDRTVEDVERVADEFAAVAERRRR
jgi:hypothetical protein